MLLDEEKRVAAFRSLAKRQVDQSGALRLLLSCNCFYTGAQFLGPSATQKLVSAEKAGVHSIFHMEGVIHRGGDRLCDRAYVQWLPGRRRKRIQTRRRRCIC